MPKAKAVILHKFLSIARLIEINFAREYDFTIVTAGAELANLLATNPAIVFAFVDLDLLNAEEIESLKGQSVARGLTIIGFSNMQNLKSLSSCCRIIIPKPICLKSLKIAIFLNCLFTPAQSRLC